MTRYPEKNHSAGYAHSTRGGHLNLSAQSKRPLHKIMCNGLLLSCYVAVRVKLKAAVVEATSRRSSLRGSEPRKMQPQRKQPQKKQPQRKQPRRCSSEEAAQKKQPQRKQLRRSSLGNSGGCLLEAASEVEEAEAAEVPPQAVMPAARARATTAMQIFLSFISMISLVFL